MAWSVGIRCAAEGSTFLGDKARLRKTRQDGRCGPPCCYIPVMTTAMFSNNQSAINYNNGNIGIMAATNSNSKALDLATALVCKGDNHNDKAAAVYEKADEWLKESVVEIVRNLREAPLLVHVYPENTLKTEKRVGEEDWPVRVDMWANRETPSPEGLIFVEQLRDEDEDEDDDVAKAWGIVVQGRGVDSGPACYLLKTSSGPGSGPGFCCTHFCLMRVQSFRETARSQLKNCWLISQILSQSHTHSHTHSQ